MIAFLGFALMQGLGSLLRALLTRERVSDCLRSPASWLLSLGLIFATALGPAGFLFGVALLLGVRHTPRSPSMRSPGLPWGAFGAVCLVVLARPWVPTQWDEFVWLGKARFESLGFGVGVQMALDPAQGVIPPGYPPLWPLAVGWLSLGRDTLDAQVVASSVLLLAAAATALEAWWPLLEAQRARRRFAVALALASPYLWVHARSAYVDLPVGLLGLSVLGFLVTDRAPLACAAAVVLSGVKDEGLPHVLAATVGAFALKRQRAVVPRLAPALLAVLVVATWRWLLHANAVGLLDHSVNAPALTWTPTLARLLAHHMADLMTWGVFWPAALAVVVSSARHQAAPALRATVVAGLIFIGFALVLGAERVRVFAENGTLINRLLVQWWPAAALLVWFELTSSAPNAGTQASATPTA